MTPMHRFCRNAGGLVEIAHAEPATGETYTSFMERLNRERREAEHSSPLDGIDGNPWITGNLTHQMILMRRDPALANDLRERAAIARREA